MYLLHRKEINEIKNFAILCLEEYLLVKIANGGGGGGGGGGGKTGS